MMVASSSSWTSGQGAGVIRGPGSSAASFLCGGHVTRYQHEPPRQFTPDLHHAGERDIAPGVSDR